MPNPSCYQVVFNLLNENFNDYLNININEGTSLLNYVLKYLGSPPLFMHFIF